jgi:hypothetical protein
LQAGPMVQMILARRALSLGMSFNSFLDILFPRLFEIRLAGVRL